MTINSDYDFITFGEIYLTCNLPYATFNIWKDGRLLYVHYHILGNNEH